MKIRLPASFEYGYYGGPNHSGEAIDPVTGLTIPFVKDPIDGLDKIFKEHDEAYAEAENYEKQGNWQKAMEIEHAADKALVDAIKGYDPYNDPLAGEGYTDQAARDAAAAYAWKAENVFGGIIRQREEMWPGLGEKTFEQIKTDQILKELGSIFEVREACAEEFNAPQKWVQPVRRDPLTLDLDGDGIETIAASNANPILFDHDGDGLKTGTG